MMKTIATVLFAILAHCGVEARINHKPFPVDCDSFDLRFVETGLKKASDLAVGSYTDKKSRIIYARRSEAYKR